MKIVVVGSSVGGVRTAQALRGEGHTGHIVLVGLEPEIPYDKPPLSKQFLSGEWDTPKVSLLTREAAVRDRIELRLGVAATGLDIAGRRVLLDDGTALEYDRVVLATGASARPSPWWTASGVHVLRTLGDSQGLRRDLLREGPVVVVGGGFIGAEVAATARALGHEVIIVDPLPTPMARVVGQEPGRHLTGLHHRHGVTTRFGVGVEAVEGTAGDLLVHLQDGSALLASTVVVGIGAVPNDDWLAGSGLRIDDGVLCDQYGRALDTPDVFAVGDVARWYHPRHEEHTRVEHWTNAVEQAACVAHNIVRSDGDADALRPHSPVEYVWSDQYDWKIQIVGRPSRATRHEIVGDLGGDKPRAAVLYTDGTGFLSGAMTVNWPRALVQCRRMVTGAASFDDVLERIKELAGVKVTGAAS